MLFRSVPDCPETGYGYIKASGPVGVNEAAAIDKFVEKPDFETATKYQIGRASCRERV